MAKNHFGGVIYVAVGLACAASYGQELPALVARLEKLDGRNPIRATVHIEDRTSRTQDKDSKPLEKAELLITADANTLSLTVTGPISDTRVLREFSLLRAGELMHCGPALARELAELKLLERRPDSHQALSCTRWRLESEQKESKLWMSSTTRKDVELWVDADGYPVAASFKTQTKANVLLLKINSESTRYQRYARWADRLVVVLDRNDTDVKTKVGDEKRTVTTTVDVEENGFDDPQKMQPHRLRCAASSSYLVQGRAAQPGRYILAPKPAIFPVALSPAISTITRWTHS